MRLIGRDHVLIEKLTKAIHKTMPHEHWLTDIRETERGFSFDVQIMQDDPTTTPRGLRPTGHIARVAVTLNRIEQPEDLERE